MTHRYFNLTVAVLTVFLAVLSGCATQHTADKKDTTVRAQRPAIVAAAEWGSQPQAFDAAYEHTPRIVLIHHAGVIWKASDDPATKLRNLQSWGQRDKNWQDVPYHFLIAPDGRIFEGRAMKYKPDTNTNFDTRGYINVHLWGDLNKQRVSAAQLHAAASLSAWLADELNMPTDQLVTHRDVAPGQTTCPGSDFYQYIQSGDFAQWMNAARSGIAFEAKLRPPLKDGPTEMIPKAE